MPTPPTPPKLLQTFTTAYDEVEDRISVVGSSANGDVVQVWLNLRLLQRVLPHVIEWVKKSDGAGARQDDRVQGFMQQSAREALPTKPPIVPAADTEKFLVRTLDLNWQVEQIDLVFKGEGDRVATIAMSKLITRQWLTIVHHLYTRAGWPLTVWPDWITEAGAAPVKGDIVRH
jgi:hypothetical protein